MRIFLIVAFSLIASGTVQAQYFAFNTDVGPIEIDIGRRYVRVPGYVELGARPYVPPPPAYYGPPPRSYYGPPRDAVVAPRGALREVIIDDDDEILYEPPRRRYAPAPRVRQPRQITTAPQKKPAPKVAAVRDASPPRESANRTAAPALTPLPAAAPAVTAPVPPSPAVAPAVTAPVSPPPAVSVPASPQRQLDIGGAKLPATTPFTPPVAVPAAIAPPPAVVTPVPPADAAPPPAAEAPAPVPTPSPTIAAPRQTPAPTEIVTQKPEAEVQKSLLERASPPRVAAAPAIAPAPQRAQPSIAPQPVPAPPVAAVTPAPSIAPAPAAPKDSPAATKPAKTQVAALPPAKHETEERAKAGPMPIGTWSSSDGQLRIDRCGSNLCGYAVGGVHAGKMVLIHMRQTRENSWSGQVKDVRSGQNYSATMSMRGSAALHIRGCAMGGLFCGSRTMSRVR